MINLQKCDARTLLSLLVLYSCYHHAQEAQSHNLVQDTKNNQTQVVQQKTIPSTQLVTVEPEEPTIQVLQLGDFDPQTKRKAVVTLVERGVQYLQNHDPQQAFSTFSHDPAFRDGELYIFVFDRKGRCLAHGQEQNLIFKDLWNLTSDYGVPVTQSIVKEGLTPTNNGWVIYHWRNATKVSYVRAVNKGDQTYILGVGYYPHAKSDSVENLVKAAVSLFYTVSQTDQNNEIAFSIMSYSAGRFVLGDLYLYAIDAKGILVAHGQRVAAIGTNSWNYQDEQGKFVNQEIVKRLQEPGVRSTWVDYISKKAPKRAYAEKVTDQEGNEYFIACGYYPTATQEKVVDLVKRGAHFLLNNGPDKANLEFTSLNKQTFRYGDLAIYVYDTNGVCIANGDNPELAGRPLYNGQDDEKVYYVQAMIDKARAGGGWLDFKFKNAFYAAYVQLVKLDNKEYVVGSGTYPVSKRETMELLARSAAGYLRSHDPYESFALFSGGTHFLRGDLDIFVFDQRGICYSYGSVYESIWKNLLTFKDDDGREIVKLFINTVKHGAGRVTYRLHGRKRLAYVEPVEKAGMRYVVGSSFSY